MIYLINYIFTFWMLDFLLNTQRDTELADIKKNDEALWENVLRYPQFHNDLG